MGIRQRGSSWEINVTYKGARKFCTVTTTEQDAKDKEEELRAELILENRKGQAQPTEQPAAPSWTLGQALKKTFEVRWTGTKSEDFYKQQAGVLLEHFGKDTPLAAITTDAVDGLRKALKARGNNSSTITKRLVTLSMAFKIANQRGAATVKPTLGITRSTRGRIRFLTEAEEKIQLGLLTKWGKNDLADWYTVLVDTGMRPSETRKMTGAWCDFRATTGDDGLPHGHGVVHVADSKTESGIRPIPMTKRVAEVLERRCLAYPKGKLFPKAWAVFTNAWLRTTAIMDLEDDRDFVPYALRHTFATRLIQRGVRVEVIQRLLGHRTSDQTMVYAKLGARQYVDAISKLEPVQ